MHDRKLVLGGAGSVPGRLRFSGAAIDEVRDEVERLMLDSAFLQGAPFRWIGLIFRYGTETRLVPEYGKIDKKDGELPITIELEMEKLRRIDRPKLHDELKRTFMLATLDALIHVGKRYSLPTEVLQAKRSDVYDSSFRPPGLPAPS